MGQDYWQNTQQIDGKVQPQSVNTSDRILKPRSNYFPPGPMPAGKLIGIRYGKERTWVGAWHSKLIWLTPIETLEIVAKQIFTLYPSGLSLGLVSALAAGVENFLALFRQQLSAKCSWLYFDSGGSRW